MIVESYEDVIILSGALRSNFWQTVHTAISLTLKRHPSGVIIDCSGITECTVEGVDTFRDILHFIESQDARVIVAAVPANIRDVFRSVPEVRSQLPVAETVDDARRSLDLLVETPGKKKRKPGPMFSSKLVLLLRGEEQDRDGLEAAIRMSRDFSSQVVATFVIVVPRHQPLTAPMSEDEELAKSAFEPAKAMLSEADVNFVVKVERGRDFASTLEDVVQEERADYLLVPLAYDGNAVDEELKLVKSILTKVQGTVGFLRPKPRSIDAGK
ncbi:MAG: STAS domain-containing protein [Fimbriimonadaceae bacterium]|nr:STAS domain-containing protein [Fimbriimonadaceae bacterium]